MWHWTQLPKRVLARDEGFNAPKWRNSLTAPAVGVGFHAVMLWMPKVSALSPSLRYASRL
jgi:hypothetical protein